MWVSETVGKIAFILATCSSTSVPWMNDVSIFFIGVGEPIVISPNLFVVALIDLDVDIGVFKSLKNNIYNYNISINFIKF